MSEIPKIGQRPYDPRLDDPLPLRKRTPITVSPLSQEAKPLNEFRCTNCNKLVAKVELKIGTVQVKCVCGTVNTVSAE